MRELEKELSLLTDSFKSATGAFYNLKENLLRRKYSHKRSKRISVSARKQAWGLYVAYGMDGGFESYLDNFKCTDIALSLFFTENSDTSWLDSF